MSLRMRILKNNQRIGSMMAKGSVTTGDRDALAAPADIPRIVGTLDEANLLDIMVLRPTILDVEEHRCGLPGTPMSSAPGSRSNPWPARSLQF